MNIRRRQFLRDALLISLASSTKLFGARSFTASSSQALEVSSALVSAQPLSLSVWMKANTVAPAFQNVFSIMSNLLPSYGGGFYLQMVTNTIRIVTNSGSGQSQATSSNNVVAGQWMHVCGVVDSGRSIYLDNVKVTDGTPVTAPSNLATTNLARFNSDFGTYFDGELAEAAIWNVVLQDQEVAALSKGLAPRHIRPQSLIDYWPIIGVSSPEQGIKGNLFTLVGSPSQSNHPRTYR